MFIDATDQRRSAFTLVEIVVALGLCSFVMIALLGLLQVSLQTHRESSEESLVLDVSDWILRDIRQGAKPEEEAEGSGENEGQPTNPVSRIFEIPLAAGGNREFFIGETGNPLPETNQDARFRVQTEISADERRVHLAFFTRQRSNLVPLLEIVANVGKP